MSNITQELERMAEAVKSASARAVGRMAEKIVAKTATRPTTPTEGTGAEMECMAEEIKSLRVASARDEVERAHDKAERGRMAEEIAAFRSKALLWNDKK